MSPSTDKSRRIFGAILIAAILLMTALGETFLKQHLQGLSFILYWTVCAAFLGCLIVVAWLDVRALRRRFRNEHRELVQKTLANVDLSDVAK